MADNSEAICGVYSGPWFQYWSQIPPRLAASELALVKYFCEDATSKVLVCGSGAGREAFALYDLGFRSLTGFDRTPAMVDEARKKNRQLMRSLTFVCASATCLPFDAEAFDVVTLFENIYGHITPGSARLEALREVERVLSPGGIALLVVTSIRNKPHYHAAIRVMNLGRRVINPRAMEPGDKAIRGVGRISGIGFRDVPRSHWFSPDEITRDSSEVGLETLRLSTETDILAQPHVDSTDFRGKGRLVCVLRKPLGRPLRTERLFQREHSPFIP